eukprot:CAMPEP_0177759708 /NCGR_PEP_ID=MMETSP0491_2-20121128/4873_1 /TAXON_ID=63592 /ORGANISM="Tetraselmis chuii, Strain PLY429" /LENGTH=105 /DNA_ID=CAMNT_0019275549 /DNA_START=518 /DNA_END=835 /DNA_ORIENTATION=+
MFTPPSAACDGLATNPKGWSFRQHFRSSANRFLATPNITNRPFSGPLYVTVLQSRHSSLTSSRRQDDRSTAPLAAGPVLVPRLDSAAVTTTAEHVGVIPPRQTPG